ncbi:MAG: phospholipase A, partial [Pseudomonadota bacterium]
MKLKSAHRTPSNRPTSLFWLGLPGLLAASLTQAQSQSQSPTQADSSVKATASAVATANTAPPASNGWQACQALAGDAAAQLKCFQDWAAAQTTPKTPPAAVATAPANQTTGQPAAQVLLLPALNTEAPDGKPVGCRNDKYSELSKFWELQRGTDCDTFAIRGYRPISLAVVASDSVNQQPSSSAAGHTALTSVNYRRTENKIQLSVRTKIAKGLFKSGPEDDDDHDSLWFGYSQQSYWQLFSPSISRPFRSTDHEPEVIYIYPHQLQLPGGWSYRLSGIGLVHQSNGQSLP